MATPPTNPPTGTASPQIDSQQMQAAIQALTAAMKMFQDAITNINSNLSGTSSQATVAAAAVNKVAAAAQSSATSLSNNGTAVQQVTESHKKLTKSMQQQHAWALIEIEDQKEKAAQLEDQAKKTRMLKNLALGGLSIAADLVQFWGKKVMAVVRYALVALNPLEYLETLGRLTKQYEDILRTIEQIRGEFGKLQQGTASFVFQTAKTVDSSLKSIGLSAYRILGTPSKVLEEMFSFMKDLGAAGSEAFRRFGATAINNLMIVQKGLGLTTDDAAFLAETAMSSGKSIDQVTTEIVKMSTAMGEKINESPKLIARSVVSAMKDLDKFGGATVKQLAKADAYMRKLGTTLDKTAALMSQFETIEGAAESSSKMAQYFGVTVDSFKLLMAQDPAQIADELRKGFRNAGVEVANFNRHGYALLAEATGLDAQTAKTVLSLMNQGAAYTDLAAASEGAAKSHMTEGEALNKIADSIERLVHASESNLFLNIFSAFSEGIMGIDTAKEAMQAFYDESMRLQELGMELSKTLYETFPGLKGIFESLKNILNGKYISGFFGDFTKEIGKFFKDISSGNLSFESAWESIKNKFFSYFDSASPEGKKLMKSIKEFLVGIKNTIIFLAKGITSEIVNALKGVNNPDAINNSADEFGSLLSFAFNDILGPIFSQLWESFVSIAGALWERLAPNLLPIFAKIGEFFGKLVSDYIVPAILNGLTSSPWILLIGGAILVPKIISLISWIIGIFGKASAAATGTASGLSLSSLTASFTQLLPLVAALSALILVIAGISKYFGAENVLAATVALIGIAFAAVEIAFAIALIGKIPTSEVFKGTASLSALLVPIGVFMAVMAVILGGFLWFIGDIDAEKIKAGTLAFAAIIGLSMILLLEIAALAAFLGAISGTGLGLLALAAGLTMVGVMLAGIAFFIGSLGFIIAKMATDLKDVRPEVIHEVGLIFSYLAEGLPKIIDSINLFKTKQLDDNVFDPNSPTSIPSIIKSLMTTAKDVMLAIGKEQINLGNVESFNKMFRVVVDILGALGGIIQSSTPNLEMMQQGGPQYLELLKTNSNNSVKILEQLNTFVLNLKSIVDDKSITPESVSKLSGFAKVLSSLSPIIDVIKALSGHVNEVMKAYAEEDWVSDEDEVFYKQALDTPLRFFVGEDGKSGILNAMGNAYAAMVKSFDGIQKGAITPDKVNAISNALTAIGSFISGLMSGDMIGLIKEIDKNTVEMQKQLTKAMQESRFSKDGKEKFDKVEQAISGNTKEGLGRISSFISNMAESLIPVLSEIFKAGSVMDQIYDFITRFDAKYIERFKLVTDLLKVVSDIAKVVSPNDEIIKALNSGQVKTHYYQSGQVYKEFLDTTPLIKDYMASVGNIGNTMLTIIDGFKELMYSLLPLLSEMPAGSASKLRAITSLLSVYGNMISSVLGILNESIKSLLSTQIDTSKMSPETAQQFIDALKSITSSETVRNLFDTIAQSMPYFIDTLITTISGINLSGISNETINNMGKLVKVFDLVSSVMKVISESTKAFMENGLKEPIKENDTRTITQLIGEQILNINEIFKKIFSTDAADESVLYSLMNTFSTYSSSQFASSFGSSDIRETVKILRNVGRLLKSVNEVVNSLPTQSVNFDLDTFNENMKSIDVVSINNIIKQRLIIPEGSGFDENSIKEFDKFTRFMERLAERGPSINNALEQAVKISEKLTEIGDGDNIFGEIIKKLGINSLSGIDTLTTSFDNLFNVFANDRINALNQFQISLDALVTESSALNSELSLLKDNLLGLNTVQINLPKLTPTAQPSGEMSIKQTTEFVAPNLNIQVNLDVKMDAGQIETAILNNSSSRINGFMKNQYELNARVIEPTQTPAPLNSKTSRTLANKSILGTKTRV